MKDPKRLVHRLVDDAMNGNDLDVLDDICTERLAPKLRLAFQQFRGAFPDWHQEIVELVAEGDTVARFRCSGTHRGNGRGVTGHAALVEHDQQLAALALRCGDYVGGQDRDGGLGEAAVGVGEHLVAPQAEHRRGVLQRGLPEVAQRGEGGRRPQGRCLASGEAQGIDGGPGVDEDGEDGAEAERLVVGVGAHRERGPCPREGTESFGRADRRRPGAQEAPAARSARDGAVLPSGW